jgi:hypothetical protein
VVNLGILVSLIMLEKTRALPQAQGWAYVSRAVYLYYQFKKTLKIGLEIGSLYE